MSKSTKGFYIYFSEETNEMINEHLKATPHKSRSRFIEEAIRRYCCDLDSMTHRNVISEEVERIMDAKINNLGNRIAHIDFKIAVEMAVISLMLSDNYFNISDDAVRALRSEAMELVRRSSGFVKLEDALENSRTMVKKSGEN